MTLNIVKVCVCPTLSPHNQYIFYFTFSKRGSYIRNIHLKLFFLNILYFDSNFYLIETSEHNKKDVGGGGVTLGQKLDIHNC